MLNSEIIRVLYCCQIVVFPFFSKGATGEKGE